MSAGGAASHPPSAPRPAAILGLFVAVSLLTRAPFLSQPFLDLDEAAALVGAQESMRGGTLYVDFADNRPPLLYAFYALAQGVVGPGVPAVRLLIALAVLPLTAFAASAFFRHDSRGVLAGLLYLVYGASFLAHDMQSASPEVLMLLPLAVALAAVREPPGRAGGVRLLVAGILVGIATLVRQQALLWLPALALWAWARGSGSTAARTRERGVRLLTLFLGFGLPLAACYAWFAARGAARELVFWTWTHNIRYARNPIPPAEALGRGASYLLPFLLVTTPLWWASWRSRPLLGRRWLLLATVSAGALAGAFVGFRFFPHYVIPLYLPLALAAAPATALALVRRGRWGRAAVGWPLGLFLCATAVNLVLYRGPWRVYEETRPVFRRVGERLREDPCYGKGALFVWGYAPQVYAEAGLVAASRFVVPQASLTGYVPGNRASRAGEVDTRFLVREEHWDLLMGDLWRRPPEFVVDTSPSGLHGWDRFPLADFPRLERFVRSGYDAVGIVDGVWIWRRRGCAAGAGAEAVRR
jgi:4-amino-4-deoxy-L-arabinose transferase-like glycosyltransferase